MSQVVGWPLPVPESVINEFGYEALRQDKTDEALQYFRRNADENPYSANAWDSLADGLGKAGKLNEAAEAAEKANSLAKKYDLSNRDYFERHAKELKEKAGQ